MKKENVKHGFKSTFHSYWHGDCLMFHIVCKCGMTFSDWTISDVENKYSKHL